MVWFAPSDEAKAQMREIRAYIASNVAPILWAPPGTGKTQTVRSLAKEMGYEIRVVIGSRKEPSFLEGIPIVQREEGVRPYTVNALPDWFEFCLQNPRTLVFFDEISGMPEDVQSAILSLIQDREIDGIKLPDETKLIAAANDIDDAANGQYLAPPMANRFAHVPFSIPDADWVDGLRQNFGEPMAKIKDWMNADEIARANVVGERLKEELARLAGFLITNEALISPPVDRNPEKSGKAWASRRSWTNLADVLSHVDADDRLVRDNIISHTVGVDAGMAFKTWDANNNLPSIDELIAMADTHKWEDEASDYMYAVFAYSLNYLTNENKSDIVHLFHKAGESHQAVGFTMSLDLSRLLGGAATFGNLVENAPLLGKLSKTFQDGRTLAGTETRRATAANAA